MGWIGTAQDDHQLVILGVIEEHDDDDVDDCLGLTSNPSECYRSVGPRGGLVQLRAHRRECRCRRVLHVRATRAGDEDNDDHDDDDDDVMMMMMLLMIV